MAAKRSNQQDLRQLRANARTVSLPAQHAFLHSIANRYVVDGQERVSNPIGMRGKQLKAEFHIIHGATARIQKSIHCVKDLGLDLHDVVFAPIAASHTLLTDAQKDSGALVIDIGGGTTDYVLYVNGAVKQSGVIPFAGDNITQAIALRLQISEDEAERLKITGASAERGDRDETLSLAAERLNTIIYSELTEAFKLLRKQLEPGQFINGAVRDVFLTGGSSWFKGIREIAVVAFGIPAHISEPKNVIGASDALRPAFAVAIGLIDYAR